VHKRQYSVNEEDANEGRLGHGDLKSSGPGECSYPGSCACYAAVPLVMLIKNIQRGAAAGAAH